MNIEIFLTIFLILITFYLFFKRKSNQNTKNFYDYLLVGNMKSGKTTFIYKLQDIRGVDTINTLDTKSYNINLNNKVYSFLDIPGLQKFNYNIFDNLENSKKILFFIDNIRM